MHICEINDSHNRVNQHLSHLTELSFPPLFLVRMLEMYPQQFASIKYCSITYSHHVIRYLQNFFLKNIYNYLFIIKIRLHHILVVACRIFCLHCGMPDLQLQHALVVQWLRLHTPNAGSLGQSLVRKLDPLGPIKSSHATTKSLHAATYYCCT